MDGLYSELTEVGRHELDIDPDRCEREYKDELERRRYEGLRRAMAQFISDMYKRDYTIETTPVRDGEGVLALLQLGDSGLYRVANISAYLNRKNYPQISMFFQDFKSRDNAETLYLKCLDMHGFLVFGDELKLNKSGISIKHLEDWKPA